MSNKVEKATLAGGCFWCLEAAYLDVRGVSQVISGFSGGTVSDPSYELVCSGQTGHAESVQLTFDPEVVSYHDLLLVFFLIHDPTTLNRQGGGRRYPLSLGDLLSLGVAATGRDNHDEGDGDRASVAGTDRHRAGASGCLLSG